MVNGWVEFVKRYASDNDLSYACAMSSPGCKEAYQKVPNYSKQIKRIDSLIKINRRRRPTSENVQEARDLWNQTFRSVNNLSDSDKKKEYIYLLKKQRSVIQELVRMNAA